MLLTFFLLQKTKKLIKTKFKEKLSTKAKAQIRKESNFLKRKQIISFMKNREQLEEGEKKA